MTKPAFAELNASYLARRTKLLSEQPPTPARRDALCDLTTRWLGGVFHEAYPDVGEGIALAAVGGLSRGELAPGSDLDLIVLHRARGQSGDAERAAEATWYAIWDAGIRLDYSTRGIAQARSVAADDLKVALGLIEPLHIAGDESVVNEVREAARADWRKRAKQRLVDVRASVHERTSRSGELAYLLEPDLKDAYGGLRDLTILRAIAAAWITDVPHAKVAPARATLLDVRDALHDVTGRGVDRLGLQDQSAVAERLGLDDSDALLRQVTSMGRTIAFVSDTAWHAVGTSSSGAESRRGLLRNRKPQRVPLTEGVVVQDNVAVLALEAVPAEDDVLVLRAAAAAAQAGIRLAPATVTRLATESEDLVRPWSRDAREAFVSLLGAGRVMLPVWESLDQAGLITRLLPEWEHVRSAPQRNPIHRYTVDRHLIEAVINASELTRQVSRPDLLLVACLLHDIGKGLPGDHSEAGAALAREMALAIGFADGDVDTIESLVRHHLLLPETATRRDLDDPATAANVAMIVQSHETLDLLHALSRADARATGPQAWSDWRRSLIDDLVARTHALLSGTPAPRPPRLSETQRSMAWGDGVDVLVEATSPLLVVTVAAPDRQGLLATIAGVLSLHRLSVRGAQTDTIGGRAITVWSVQPSFGDPPASDRLRDDIVRALDGALDVEAALRKRAEAYAKSGITVPRARVDIVEQASADATVLEVRAHDEPGLLHRVAGAVSAANVVIQAARVATLGADAVDAFYLVNEDGKPLMPFDADRVREEVSRSLDDRTD